MDWLESAAIALLVPSGCARDPLSQLGLSNFSCEMLQRGCGERDSRRFVEDLELLGTELSSMVSASHTSFAAAMPAESLSQVLPFFADLILRPHLPAAQLESSRLVCLQEVHALEDDVAQQVRQEMRRRRYPLPLGRACQGTNETLQAIQLADVQTFIQSTYQPEGAILSVAGKIDWPALKDQVEALYAEWPASDLPPIEERPPELGNHHIHHETGQTHIGVSFASVPYRHPDYFQVRGAVGVLSDGVSSRLFAEIREERGLVYTVYASCHSLRDSGAVFCYAGTSRERAQETLDVLLAELTKLREGVRPDELDRLKAQVKTSLVLQQESSRSRASSIAGDWYHLARVRTLDEVEAIIGGLTCESINRYLSEHPPSDFSIVTLGSQPLELPVAVS